MTQDDMGARAQDIVAAGYDEIADRYREWSASTADIARDRFLGEFMDLVGTRGRVLDIGCGNGLPSTRLLADRYEVTGVDISERQLEAARANVPDATFLRGDVVSLELPPGSFDGVTMLYALSHVPRRQHGVVLERIARWLRPGGILLVTMGAEDSPDWHGEWLGTQMFFSAFDADANRQLVQRVGFEVLVADVVDTIEPDGAVPFLWVIARRR